MASLNEAFDQHDRILLHSKDLVSHLDKIETLAHSHNQFERHLQGTCDEAFSVANENLFEGDACNVVNGTCADTCQAELDALNDVCEGQTYLDGESYYHAFQVAVFKLLIDDECSAVVDTGDAVITCQGAYLALLTVVLEGNTCDDATDGTCPEECLATFKDVHERCEGQTLDGERRSYNAKVVSNRLRPFLGLECSAANLAFEENFSAAMGAYSNSLILLCLASIFLVFA